MRAVRSAISCWTKASCSGSRPGRAARRRVAGAQAEHGLEQGRAVGRVEGRLDRRVPPVAPAVQGGHDLPRDQILGCRERIVGCCRPPVGAHLLGHGRHRRQQRVAVREQLELQPGRMQPPQQVGTLGRGRRPYPWLQEGAVETEIGLGQPRHRRELALVLQAVAAQGPDVVERARAEAHHVVADHRAGGRDPGGDRRQHGLVQPGRQDREIPRRVALRQRGEARGDHDAGGGIGAEDQLARESNSA